MKELVRHIEILLLDNDCVIIPDFGGFVTQRIPSKYIEEEMLFLPPIRTVGFNEQLKENDGLLVSSFMKAYNTTELEAMQMVKHKTMLLKQELLENNLCDMGSLGQLSADADNHISFSPCQAGTICPAFYGLDALSFSLLTEETPISGTMTKPTDNKDDNVIVIRLKKSWLHNIAAAAAVIIAFLIMSPSAHNTGFVSNEKAEFAHLMTMPAPKTKQPAMPAKAETQKAENNAVDMDMAGNKPELPATNESAATKTVKETISTSNTQATRQQTANEPTGFCIVVASAIPERNAQAFVEQLKAKGHENAQVYKKGKMIRVIFPGYKTESEAYQALHNLNRQADEFSSAWVYHIK